MKKLLIGSAVALILGIGTTAWILAEKQQSAGGDVPASSEKHKDGTSAGTESSSGGEFGKISLEDVLARLPKGRKSDGGFTEASAEMVLGDGLNEPGVPSHVDRRRRKIPLLTDLTDNVRVEKIPGADPNNAPPIRFADRQDEIHYYQRLIEVEGQKIENYEKAIAEFMENDDKENAKYYLDLLNTARKNRGQHESELHKAVQKPE